VRRDLSQGLLGAVVLAAALGLAFAASASAGEAQPEETARTAETVKTGLVYSAGFASAAFSVAVSVIGAAWAVARVGTAAIGAAAEKPEIMGRSIIFIGLAEGLAIYGLIVAIMILGRLG